MDMRLAWVGSAAIAAMVHGGCADACLDGVCPELDNPHPHPGPCESAMRSSALVGDCQFTYDAQARVELADCGWSDPAHGDGGWNRATWRWDASGAPRSIAHKVFGPFTSDDVAWTFGTTEVVAIATGREPGTRTYDRAMFALWPDPGRGAARPHAELGLIARDGTTYTWTTDGPRRIRTGGGTEVSFELDAAGRLIQVDAAVRADRFAYDGDRVVRHEWALGGTTHVETYAYDRGGNLVERVGLGEREVFGYACW